MSLKNTDSFFINIILISTTVNTDEFDHSSTMNELAELIKVTMVSEPEVDVYQRIVNTIETRSKETICE